MQARRVRRDVCQENRREGRPDVAGGERHMPRRAKIEHGEDWQQVELLCERPEQVAYERVRSSVVFGDSVAERSRQTARLRVTFKRIGLLRGSRLRVGVVPGGSVVIEERSQRYYTACPERRANYSPRG